MRKKAILVCTLCTILLAGCAQQDNGQTPEESSETGTVQETAAVQETTADLSVMMANATAGCQIGEEGQPIEQGGVTYCVDSVTMTKQQGDWMDISGAMPELDANGCIVGDESYVVIHVTVQIQEECDFWWNQFWLSSFEEDDLRIGPRELVSCSLVQNYDAQSVLDNDIYHANLAVGDEVEADLIFTLYDDEYNEKAHFLLEYNPTGTVIASIKPENHSMIYLKSLEDMKHEDVDK